MLTPGLQISDLLVASLTIDETPVPRKIARLHLVSDILHNASASLPNAWVYRSIFETKLPAVFDHLGDIYLSFPGRMKAEQFRSQVMKVSALIQLSSSSKGATDSHGSSDR